MHVGEVDMDESSQSSLECDFFFPSYEFEATEEGAEKELHKVYLKKNFFFKAY